MWTSWTLWKWINRSTASTKSTEFTKPTAQPYKFIVRATPGANGFGAAAGRRCSR